MKHTEFKVGDKVKYDGLTYVDLLGKDLVVKYIRDYSGIKVIAVEDDNRFYDPSFFVLVEDEPMEVTIRELLFDHCNAGIIDDGGAIFVDIVNDRIQKTLKTNYTKQDLLHVLRTLEKYHVKATIGFNSTLDDSLSITIYAEDILEELGNNTPETLPVAAIVDLCCRYSICLSIKDYNSYYVLGHNGMVYDTKEYNVTKEG